MQIVVLESQVMYAGASEECIDAICL